MFIQVFFIPSGGSRPLLTWDETNLPEIDESTWKFGAQVWPMELLKNTNAGVDIFLVLQSEFIEEIYDAAIIGDILRCARMYTWGANIYVVVDQSLDRRRGQHHIQMARENFFKVLDDHRITDILEASIQGAEIEEIPLRLFPATARSRNRRKHLQDLAALGEWRCYLNQPPATVASFLEPFRDISLNSDDKNYLLVPLEERKFHRDSMSPLDFVKSAFAEHQGGSFAVGYLDETSLPPPDDLQRLCKERGCQILEFRGLFELHYFLQTLTAIFKKRLPALEDGEDFVRLADKVRFHPAVQPTVLITHSFTPDDDVEQCSEAARDAYEITQRLPSHCRIVVYPAINCEVLPDLVEPLRDLTAWVHIGHGESALGLRESGQATVFKTPQQWLECFLIDEEFNRSLALVCFACCQSAEVARLFAASGVHVAVGFTTDIEVTLCRAVSKEVVVAAAAGHGDRNKILAAFRRGRSRLKGITNSNPKAVAFFSGH